MITREDLYTGRVGFTTIGNDGALPPFDPGEALRHEFLVPLGLSAHGLSLAPAA
jgi:hypothetical protein